MNKTMKAQIAIVNFGDTEIEGLLLANGEFAVAVPQIADLFQFNKNQASRELKPLLAAGFQFDKALSSLHPRKIQRAGIEPT